MTKKVQSLKLIVEG